MLNILINTKKKNLGSITLMIHYTKKILISLATHIKNRKIMRMMGVTFMIKHYKK
jgi:hypothetical protein